MPRLVLIRHGPTSWNAAGIVQGRSDIPLSEAGREAVRRWVLPRAWAEMVWFTSPLRRAVETADILCLSTRPDARLVEMDWGAWEGRRLEALRQELGDLMRAWEARGLDFCAPEGESPRMVQQRVSPFLAEIAKAGVDAGAVCHKGVIRAIYALATGWDMASKPQHKLRDGTAHTFHVDQDGRPTLVAANHPLDQTEQTE